METRSLHDTRQTFVVALQHKRSHSSPGDRVVALHFGPPSLPECSWVPLGTMGFYYIDLPKVI